MTKDELYKSIASPNCVSINSVSIGNYLDEFFESNVCIPKGENRHPYADVLHEALEDTAKIVEFKYKWDNSWIIDSEVTNTTIEYRIKPKEPVYEWQWETQIGKVKTTFDYMTDEEALAFEHETSFYGIKRKYETQRERK